MLIIKLKQTNLKIGNQGNTMKDIPHHMSKFLKKIAKEHPPQESNTEEDALFKTGCAKEKSTYQKRKQKKLLEKKERNSHIPSDKTQEERNRKIKGRRRITIDRVPLKKGAPL